VFTWFKFECRKGSPSSSPSTRPSEPHLAHTARFDAHLDQSGIALTLELPGPDKQRKSVHMHFHYALFAEILRDLAKTTAALPPQDILHREALRDSAKVLYLSLQKRSTESKKRLVGSV
jgi:hypothetical protein